MEKRLMNVRPPLVPHRQSLALTEPGEVPLHHPAMPPQPLLALDPPPRDP